MIVSLKKIINWFKTTFRWWFFTKTLFGRIGLLFALAAFVLVFLTYFLINWELVEKDTILDAHDAYHHYTMVDDWAFNHNADNYTEIIDELDNLRIKCAIYKLSDIENNIENCDLIEPVWIYSGDLKLNICDYQSYNDTEIIDSTLRDSGSQPINIPGYVSFGQISNNHGLFEASVIEDEKYRYLLVVTDYSPPDEFLAFLPTVVLASLFMLMLFLLIRRFLSPINIISNRIKALEKGDLDSIISINGSDELSLLANKFNDLIQQIKKLLNQKESLLSDVSHELRTPLAKIKLLLELELTEKNKVKINNQIQYLDSLITNILIADKMSTPYSELALSKIKLSDLISTSLEYSKIKDIDVDIQDNLVLNVDAIKMSVVIKNLLDNAAKYAKNDTHLIKLIAYKSLNKNKVFANIAIEDRGPGIPDDMINKILQPFVQVDKKASGFGLGLAISKKVLKAHNGSLAIKNNKEKGCTFTAIFPIIQ